MRAAEGMCGRVSLSMTEEGLEMTAIRAGYQSLSQLADLNWDRLLYAATIVVALVAGSFFGQLLL